jgi:hypothetical protein
MTRDPWTDPDPQPGDFDTDLANLDPARVEQHPPNPEAKLTILVGVAGEDAERLERLAAARGVSADALIAELLREAEVSTA